MMRKSIVIALLGVTGLLGYALRTPPVAAQGGAFQPFTVGASVRLTVDDFPSGVGTINCKVSGVHNEFIACEGDDRQRPPRWVNRRYVQEITPAADR